MGLASDRIAVDGAFFRANDEPFRTRGVTYGSFATRVDGWKFPERAQIKEDLLAIAEAGLNTVRTYLVPPPDMIEIAEELELRLLIGLDYHDWRTEPHHGRQARHRILAAGRRAVAEAMDVAAGNSTVLGIAVANEIPVDLVRLHGAGAVEHTLSQLIAEIHDADPDMLATYVNYPTTEYLEPAGQDFAAFNVFLERPVALRKYLQHLQVVAGSKPLLVTEFGLASELHGEVVQAESLEHQVLILDEIGCAGGTIFAWTDEWAVNDQAVEGWGFGITDADREPKPALDVVQAWGSAEVPAGLREEWPPVSVIVCARDEEEYIGACLTSLTHTTYPELEVIVCDDGSRDRTLEIAMQFPFRVLELPPMGLSAARNAGLEAARGQIVAYLDADAACHPDWPYHLVLSLEDPEVVATGGPNLPFADAGFVERAVGLSPGTAAEVLITADRAEHVPGCNMAFEAKALREVGGFNPAFTSAGDDVDVCWKLLDRGHRIGFAPAAQVRHHRRETITGYLKQQLGYGRAERMLASVHPHRFNGLGQARWSGVLYRSSRLLPSLLRPVVYTGWMGAAPFQPVARRRSQAIAAWMTALMPLVVPAMVLGLAMAAMSALWLILPLMLIGLVGAFGWAIAVSTELPKGERRPGRLRALVGLLHVLQPLARAWGRLWGPALQATTVPAVQAWIGDRLTWIDDFRVALERAGCSVRFGPPGAWWDLAVRRGPVVSARLVTAVVWQWEPRLRVSYRLHWFALASLVTGATLGAIGLDWGWAMAGVAGIWMVAATMTLRRRIKRAFAFTTAGMRT